MKHGAIAAAAAAAAIGLIASGCGGSADGTPTPTAATTAESAAHASPATSAAPVAPEALQALLPTPDNVRENHGPDPIPDGGIRLRYVIDGAPAAATAGFKSALAAKGWNVTTIVSSDNEGGGGATYTATHGEAYSVIDGGGYQNNTFLTVCAWGAKPAEPNCSRDR